MSLIDICMLLHREGREGVFDLSEEKMEGGSGHEQWKLVVKMELVMEEEICIYMAPEGSHFNCNGGYDKPNCWITMYKKNLHHFMSIGDVHVLLR